MAELIGSQASVAWSGNEIDESVLFGHAAVLRITRQLHPVERFGDIAARLSPGTEEGISAVRFWIDSALTTAPPKPTGTHATLTITTVTNNTYAVKAIVQSLNYNATQSGGQPQFVGYDFAVSLSPSDNAGTAAITVA